MARRAFTPRPGNVTIPSQPSRGCVHGIRGPSRGADLKEGIADAGGPWSNRIDRGDRAHRGGLYEQSDSRRDGGGGGDTGGGASGEQVTIELWTFEEEDFLATLESDFEAANPNIDLDITAYPEENYGVKLDTAIAAGKEPDLTLYPGPEEIRAGLIMPIDDMVAEEGIDLSTYVPAIVEPGDELSCAWEDHLYCLGSFAGSVQMLYNKDMFDAAGIPYPAPWPPMTPDEFVDIACQLTDAENEVWGGAASDPLSYMPGDMLYSPDGRTATGYVNGPEVVHQVDVLASGFEQGCFPAPNAVDPWSQGMDYFSKGQLGMVITDFAGLEKVEKAGINYGSTAPPTPEGVDPVLLRVDRQRRRDVVLGAPRRGARRSSRSSPRTGSASATRPPATSRSIWRSPTRWTGRPASPAARTASRC